jgi:hypothetical protein
MTALCDRLTIRPAEPGELGRVVEICNAGMTERVGYDPAARGRGLGRTLE